MPGASHKLSASFSTKKLWVSRKYSPPNPTTLIIIWASIPRHPPPDGYGSVWYRNRYYAYYAPEKMVTVEKMASQVVAFLDGLSSSRAKLSAGGFSRPTRIPSSRFVRWPWQGCLVCFFCFSGNFRTDVLLGWWRTAYLGIYGWSTYPPKNVPPPPPRNKAVLRAY